MAEIMLVGPQLARKLGIPAVEAVEIVVPKNELQKVYPDIAYKWFSRARRQLSS